MRRYIYLALAASMGALGCAVKEEKLSGDWDRLQGAWVVVSAESGGQTDLLYQGGRFTFAGNKVVQETINGQVEFAFTLDESMCPGRLDAEDWSRVPFQGIYRLDGHRLTLCLARIRRLVDRDQRLVIEKVQRPTHFDSRLGLLLVLRRETAPPTRSGKLSHRGRRRKCCP
jgi:uncharacterized protein (TIGR03067 family)